VEKMINFKPFSPPSLKMAQAQDPAFAKLVHTLALTRVPRHCDLVVEAKRGLSAYIKLRLNHQEKICFALAHREQSGDN
jgi:hypothetical protein